MRTVRLAASLQGGCIVIARLILGAIVIGPAFYWQARMTLREFAVALLLAIVIAACMPDEWHE